MGGTPASWTRTALYTSVAVLTQPHHPEGRRQLADTIPTGCPLPKFSAVDARPSPHTLDAVQSG